MTVLTLLVLIIILGALGFFIGRNLARRSVNGNEIHLHSRAQYYGWNVVVLTALPALLLLVVSLYVAPLLVERNVGHLLVASDIPSGASENLALDQIRAIAHGLNDAVAHGQLSAAEALAIADDDDPSAQLRTAGVTLASDATTRQIELAQEFRRIEHRLSQWRGLLVLAAALVGFAIGLRQAHGQFRARNQVERAVRYLLVAAALVAILTTVGIVASMLVESIHFFQLYSPIDFFFGLTWSPSFGGGAQSKMGFLPLFWGTLYISVVALMVAVPVGLFAAIYLAEYASPAVRSTVKPLLEVLAGIPSIVYGLFALTTFGPWLLQWFGRDGFGIMPDARAVITAGVVMGIRLIPFISSLSDDIISAVPNSLRDASYGLGSTQSETVRLVILPAALPGIVGAILLAASRAIGETMIVVLGAGAIAKISPNPFEAMTTITTRIVAQLTGDGDFASAETLVAFALGLTLFAMTLMMNVYALYIVRKYQEQYE